MRSLPARRCPAPPIRFPCHYGVDMSSREEMVAHERTVDEIAEHLGADSLAYLSLDGVYEAIGTPAEDHCDACFTGDYPTPVPSASLPVVLQSAGPAPARQGALPRG